MGLNSFFPTEELLPIPSSNAHNKPKFPSLAFRITFPTHGV